MTYIKMAELLFKKHDDERGYLISIDSEFDIPFDIKRIFYIIPKNNSKRGQHAHKKCKQIIFPIQGSFDLNLFNGKESVKFSLNKSNKGVFIPLLHWIEIENFSKDCIVMVLCSYKYDEEEYIRDYSIFLQEVGNKNTPIECFSLKKQTEDLKRLYMNKIENIIDKNEFVMGSEVKVFEEKFCKFNNSKYCIAVSNGCSALKIAIKSLELKNPKILVQSNTYVAVPLVCDDLNYPYDIIDIDDNLLLDIEKLEEYLSNNKDSSFDIVVVVVHLYGNSIRWEKLYELKNEYKFKIIEDAAQAHGSKYRDKFLGTFGDLGCFSFYPSKNLGSLGEGGAIITDNKKYAEFCKYYRNYGSIKKYEWKIKGFNERMHNIQGGILSIKLDFLNDWNNQRRKLQETYVKNLKEHDDLKIVKALENCISNVHLFVIIVNKREELVKYLKLEKINTAIHYPQPFYESEAYSEKKIENSYKTDFYKNRLLSLPMFPELGEENVVKICDKINFFFNY